MKSQIKIFAIGIFLISWSSFATAQALTYQINIDSKNPNIAKVIVDSSELGKFELSPSRITRQDKKSELVVFCDKQKGIKVNKPLFFKCNQITWDISFKTLDKKGEDLTLQNNLFVAELKPWWLIYEWGNFPRFAGNSDAQVCISNNNISRCKPLPSIQEPPFIMAFGNSKLEYKSSNIEISLFGEFDIKEASGVLDKYKKSLTYLKSVIPTNKDNKKWDLIWLPIEKSFGSMGGVAGYNSFVANYPVENGKWTKISEAWLLKISAHETMHVISGLNNPLWAEESLAEYYAFKAIDKFGMANNNPLLDLEQSKAKIPHLNSGLYYAQNRVNKHKDMSFYPLFYVKGAAFWYEVDMALQKKDENLDEYIKLLYGLTYKDGKLPKKFETALKIGMSIEVWDRIKKAYLLD